MPHQVTTHNFMIHTLGAVDLTPEMAQMLQESIQVTCTSGSTGQMELFSISDTIGAVLGLTKKQKR